MLNRGNEGAPLLPLTKLVSNRRPCCPTRGCIASRPARFILLWNFAVLLAYKMFYDTSAIMQVSESSLGPIVINVVITFVAVFSPLAGVLTDVKFSRYKVVLCCSYALIAELVLSFLLLTLIIGISLATGKLNQQHFQVVRIPIYLSLTVLVGALVLICVVFLINAFQFGMDQLHDSSTEDHILYIHWYVWLYYTSTLVVNLTWNLLFYDTHFVNYIDGIRLSGFVMLFVVIVAMISLIFVSMCVFRCRRVWFLLESPRVKPYALLCRVIRFAYRHKVPVNRSAFTYCEDEIPSRLDLGKFKYGGPFTTKQVEDVKAFLGVLKVILSLGPAFLLQTIIQAMLPPFSRHNNVFYFIGNRSHQVHIEGVARHIILSNGLLSPLLVVLCIPLYLWFVRPRIVYLVPRMLQRIGMGMVLIVLSFLSTFAMDLVLHLKYEEVDCMFSGYGNFYGGSVVKFNNSTPLKVNGESLYQNAYFFAVQYVLSALINMLIDIAILEFICSQSPYSMKGVLFGVFFSTKSFFEGLAIVSILPFTSWHTEVLSCGSVFYLVSVAVSLLELGLYFCVARRYKYRTVDEPSNEYRYAEDYYSNIQ